MPKAGKSLPTITVYHKSDKEQKNPMIINERDYVEVAKGESGEGKFSPSEYVLPNEKAKPKADSKPTE